LILVDIMSGNYSLAKRVGQGVVAGAASVGAVVGVASLAGDRIDFLSDIVQQRVSAAEPTSSLPKITLTSSLAPMERYILDTTSNLPRGDMNHGNFNFYDPVTERNYMVTSGAFMGVYIGDDSPGDRLFYHSDPSLGSLIFGETVNGSLAMRSTFERSTKYEKDPVARVVMALEYERLLKLAVRHLVELEKQDTSGEIPIF
jgi:hypothetical protein